MIWTIKNIFPRRESNPSFSVIQCSLVTTPTDLSTLHYSLYTPTKWLHGEASGEPDSGCLANNVPYLFWRRKDCARSSYRILPRIKATHTFVFVKSIVILPSYGCVSEVAPGFPFFACSLQSAFRMFVWMCDLGIWSLNKPSRINLDYVISLFDKTWLVYQWIR